VIYILLPAMLNVLFRHIRLGTYTKGGEDTRFKFYLGVIHGT
jgi:hypothetical protein